MLASLRPDALVFLPTPLNLVTTTWLDDQDFRIIGFASYPFYNADELIVAAYCIGWPDVKQYFRHLLVPRFVWIGATRRRVHALVSQSVTTAKRLESMLSGVPASLFIPPGIDLTQWPFHAKNYNSAPGKVRLLYLGSATSIRGLHVTLDALALLRDNRVRLRILARGADVSTIDVIRTHIAKRKVNALVDVEGGWVDRRRLIREIHAADAVLQPFILVPSELPVTAMEVIACGTPVIGSAIDGLPSTIGPAGSVVPQGSAHALARGIRNLADDESIISAWREGCRQQRSAMLDWNTVVDQWEALLGG